MKYKKEMARYRKNMLGRGSRRYKGLQVGTSLVKLENKKDATIDGGKGARERVGGSRQKSDPGGCS